MNLLEETKEAIKRSGHKVTDIIYIGNAGGYSCTWAEFKKLADKKYDSGFGAAKVATDLRIIFKDNQTMWRGEYDGSEWWEYSEPLVIPEKQRPIKNLVGAFWPSLEDLHDPKDTHHNPNPNLLSNEEQSE